MLKIGLTGGIGSGKTMVAQIFEVLAIPVYYADKAARYLMNSDVDLKNKIIRTFGPAAYKEGILDNTYLGSIVFNDPEKLAQLNSFVHPVTIRDAEKWMRKQTAPYVVKEAAIIFEAGLEKNYDYIICVTAPEALRVERVLERDHSTAEKIRQRMKQQMDEQEKINRSNFVINNDGTRALLPQVLAVHKTLLENSGIREFGNSGI
jgi:dephospho-CoA kinase